MRPRPGAVPTAAEAELRQRLAVMLQDGNAAAAKPLLQKLLAQNPDDAALWHTLGEAELRLNGIASAIKAFGKAIDKSAGLTGRDEAVRSSSAQMLARLFATYTVPTARLLSRRCLLHLTGRDDLDQKAVAAAAMPFVMQTPPWRRWFEAMASDAAAATKALLRRDGVAARSDALFLALLTKGILAEPQVDRLLHHLPGALADALESDHDPALRPFLAACAYQAWHTGHAATPGPTDPPDRNDDPVIWLRALIAGPPRPDWPEDWPDALRPLKTLMVDEPAEQAACADAIPELTPSDAAASGDVRAI